MNTRKHFEAAQDALMAFDWSATKQGNSYWSGVYEELEKALIATGGLTEEDLKPGAVVYTADGVARTLVRARIAHEYHAVFVDALGNQGSACLWGSRVAHANSQLGTDNRRLYNRDPR